MSGARHRPPRALRKPDTKRANQDCRGRAAAYDLSGGRGSREYERFTANYRSDTEHEIQWQADDTQHSELEKLPSLESDGYVSTDPAPSLKHDLDFKMVD